MAFILFLKECNECLVTSISTSFYVRTEALSAVHNLLGNQLEIRNFIILHVYLYAESQFGVCNDLTHTTSAYLKLLLPHWKRTTATVNGKRGSPVLLIVCGSGVRAVQIIRLIILFVMFLIIRVAAFKVSLAVFF
jgi:hypothetical protein